MIVALLNKPGAGVIQRTQPFLSIKGNEFEVVSQGKAIIEQNVNYERWIFRGDYAWHL